jgi:Fe-S cluster assembly protein SufD
VKCSHGATVGDLDEAQLFYLQARGIPAPVARRMLIDAFAAEVVDLVEDVPARDYLKRHLGAWLEAER